VTVDQQISNAFALLAVLLVFVIAYYSALLPQANDLMARPRPPEDSGVQALVARLRSYRALTAGYLALIALVMVVLYPLTRDVIEHTPWRWPVPTLRAGLLLVDLCLLGMLVAGARLWQRLAQRADSLSRPPPTPKPVFTTILPAPAKEPPSSPSAS
jgi:uncharacterized integral membrane protein